MNVLVQELARGDISEEPANRRLVLEDNVGESIHLHYREFRYEMSINDFQTFAAELQQAHKKLASNSGHGD